MEKNFRNVNLHKKKMEVRITDVHKYYENTLKKKKWKYKKKKIRFINIESKKKFIKFEF